MSRLFKRWRIAGHHLRVAWYALRDPQLGRGGKLLLALLAVYVISPVDLVPDGLPLLGWLDDLVLLGMVVPALLKLLPAEVLARARQRAAAPRQSQRRAQPPR